MKLVMARYVGIWLDKREAKIVVLDNKKVEFTTIVSEVEEFHPKGGSGTRFKGGPQDVVQDSKYTERKKHQLKNYFRNIIKNLPQFDQLVVFGPSQTRTHFVDELSGSYKEIYEKVVDVVREDSMTDNQIRAWVESFFDKQLIS